MTRKTQIGLLTAACVLCCAGVFLGARLSNRSHAAAENTPMTIEPPDLPTPIITDSGASKPAIETKDTPTIAAVVETPPSAPILPATEPSGTAKEETSIPAKLMDAKDPDALPPLPPPSVTETTDRESAKPRGKPMPRSEIVAVNVEEPATNAKVDTPPPPPPSVGAIDTPPSPRAGTHDASPKRELSAPPALPGKDVPEKTPIAPPGAPIDPPSKSVGIPEPPPPSSAAPSDTVPPPIRTPTPEPPVVTQPGRIEPSVSPMPTTLPADRDTAPHARVVPVSPTTPESAKVTPVIKKPAGKAKMLPMTGTHVCKMDRDHGVTLPKEVRDQLGEQDVLFVTLGTDHSVWVTTAAGLEKLADRLEKTPDVDDETKVIRRRYFAQTERVTVDKAGHIVLPAALADSAGLKQDAVLIGVGDHLELWDAQRWQKVSQPTPSGETPEPSAADSHEEL